jgi:hypothetical protein
MAQPGRGGSGCCEEVVRGDGDLGSLVLPTVKKVLSTALGGEQPTCGGMLLQVKVVESSSGAQSWSSAANGQLAITLFSFFPCHILLALARSALSANAR